MNVPTFGVCLSFHVQTFTTLLPVSTEREAFFPAWLSLSRSSDWASMSWFEEKKKKRSYLGQQADAFFELW